MKKYFIMAVILPVIAGCQQESGDMGQTLAQVNGKNITATQYTAILRQLPPDSLNERERRKVAEKMIDQELAVQKAVELKLDRQPKVLNQLEQARREILAGAFADYIVNTLPAPDANKVSVYYLEHPELFGERKIFQLNELVLPLNLRENEAFVALIKAASPQEKIINWLTENSIPFRVTASIRPAEKLPIQALATLNKARIGSPIPFETPEAIILYFITASQEAPISWKQAEAGIIEHFEKLNLKEALEKEIERERSQSEIKVFAEFSKLLE